MWATRLSTGPSTPPPHCLQEQQCHVVLYNLLSRQGHIFTVTPTISGLGVFLNISLLFSQYKGLGSFFNGATLKTSLTTTLSDLPFHFAFILPMLIVNLAKSIQ